MTRHILLIEKDEDGKNLFDTALKRIPANFFLMHAEGPQTAIRILKQFRPDIVFIASELPGKSIQLLKQIRLLKDCAQLPVYIYTQVLDAALALRALLSGAAGCLLKTENEEYLTNSLYGIVAAETDPEP